MRLLPLCLSGLMLPAAAGVAPAGVAPKHKPNVLIVMTDDQGYGDFSCHGNPVLKTPNLDKLHARSTRFTDFHVAPMCTPTRGQLLTGRDALRNGATSVTAGRSFLRPGNRTLAEMLRAAGYRTGLFGKWHLGDNYPHRPMDRGFEKAVYHLGWGITSAPEFSNRLFDGRFFEDGAARDFKGYMTDFWFERAIAWMKDRQTGKEPFFCYLATNAPHAPHDVAPKYSEPYKKHKAANFFGMIANIDENVGRLLDFLKSSGLEENTIIIFLTDNGGTAGVSLFNAGMRAGKTTYYEGGHRVPCWVSWPAGKLPPPRDIAVPTQVQDLLPTVLDLCGVAVPKDGALDGRSLAGLLRGKEKTPPERMLVVQYGQVPKKSECCVIWNQWRLVKGSELYDIKTDAAQKEDVAAKHPEVVKRMTAHYDEWWKGVEGLVGEFVPTHIGAMEQPLVSLTSSDWRDIYSDNSKHVRTAVGGPRGGVWTLHVEKAGDYEIALRRWARETDLPLGGDAGVMSHVIKPAVAKLKIGGKEHSLKTTPEAKEVILRVTLAAGDTTLQAWFEDAAGKELCGAFYAYVKGPER